MASSSIGYCTYYCIDLSKAEAKELVEIIEWADDFGIPDDVVQSTVLRSFSGAPGWPIGQEIDIPCLLYAARNAIHYGGPVNYVTSHDEGYDGDASDSASLSNNDNTGDSEFEDSDSEMTYSSLPGLIEASDHEHLYAAFLDLGMETDIRLVRAPLGPEPYRHTFLLHDGDVGLTEIGPEVSRPAIVVSVDVTVALRPATKRRILKAKRTIQGITPHSDIGFRWPGNFVRFDLFINDLVKDAPEVIFACVGAFLTTREWQWSMCVCKQWRTMLIPTDVHYNMAGVMDIKSRAQLPEIVDHDSIPGLVVRNMTISLCDRIWMFGNTSAAHKLASTCRSHRNLMHNHARSMVVLSLREVEHRLNYAMEQFDIVGLAIDQLESADLDHIFLFHMYPQLLFRVQHPIFVLR